MGVSWGALAGAFLAPFLYGLYWKGATKAGVVSCFVFGTGIEIIQLFVQFKVFEFAPGGFLSFVFTNSLYSGVFAMLGGLILLPLVSIVTKKPEKNTLDEVFSCYNKKVTVDVTDSLGKN